MARAADRWFRRWRDGGAAVMRTAHQDKPSRGGGRDHLGAHHISDLHTWTAGLSAGLKGCSWPATAAPPAKR